MPVQINGSGGLTFADGTSQTTASYGQFRNRIINGDMRIDQRNAGNAVSLGAGGGDYWSADRWQARNNTDASYTIQSVEDAPAGFHRSLRVTITGADTSLGTSQYAQLRQHIEGHNFSDFAWGTSSAQPITFSFWVKSSVTGTHTFALTNANNARGYAANYTINAANAWEYKTVVIPGDTSGVWSKDGGVGLRIAFCFGSGSSFLGVANTWVPYELMGVTGANMLVNTNGATWHVTGVQVEGGSVATPFERRPIGTEFHLCQRYFQQMYVRKFTGLVYTPNGDTRSNAFQLGTPMRAVPSTSPASVTSHSINLGQSGEVINNPTVQWNVNTFSNNNSGAIGFDLNQSQAYSGYPNSITAFGAHCDTMFSFNAEMV